MRIKRLKLSGFYELVPAGEEGNLTGIQPRDGVRADTRRPEGPG